MDLIREDIVSTDLQISKVSRAITNPKRIIPILLLVTEERKLIKLRQELTNNLHGLQNRIFDMGRGPVFGISTPQRIINQYAK